MHVNTSVLLEPGTGGEADFGRQSGPARPELPWNSPAAPPLSNQELPHSWPGSFPGETGIEITPPAARPCTGYGFSFKESQAKFEFHQIM